MGVGYALYCAPGHGHALVALASELGYRAELSGVVEEGPREVVLEPVGVRYSDRELELSLANTDPPPQL